MRVHWTSSELIELVLGILAFLWGILLLLPGNSLVPYGGINLYNFYSSDWLYGIYLTISGIFIIFTTVDGYLRIRKFIHASLWIFWLGIAVIVASRVFSNGVSATDILLILPFVAIAFFHAVIYARLAGLNT